MNFLFSVNFLGWTHRGIKVNSKQKAMSICRFTIELQFKRGIWLFGFIGLQNKILKSLKYWSIFWLLQIIIENFFSSSNRYILNSMELIKSIVPIITFIYLGVGKRRKLYQSRLIRYRIEHKRLFDIKTRFHWKANDNKREKYTFIMKNKPAKC